MCGEFRFRLAPTKTDVSPLDPKWANWLVVETCLSRFSSGVCSRIAMSLVVSAGMCRYKMVLPFGDQNAAVVSVGGEKDVAVRAVQRLRRRGSP